MTGFEDLVRNAPGIDAYLALAAEEADDYVVRTAAFLRFSQTWRKMRAPCEYIQPLGPTFSEELMEQQLGCCRLLGFKGVD